MAETELREKITIDGAEAAAQKLGLVSGAAKRVMHAFEGIGELAAVAGGIAGAWQVVEGVREVDRLYQAVMRVQDMTGMAAEKAHALFDMFELSGVQMESAERIITSMTKQGQKLEDGMSGVGGAASRMTTLMSTLGVKIKDGPEERLLAMSKAAKAGKLDMAELTMAFGIPRSQASAMMSMLKQGPEKLKEIQKGTLEGADVIDNKTMESYRQMLQVRRELKDAFGDLIGVFYKNLIPAITLTLQTIKKQFDDIAPIAASIGRMLSNHMELVVRAAKTYLALTIATKAINMFSENKLGIAGRGKQIFGGMASYLGRGRAAAGAADYFEAKAMSPGAGMFAKAGGNGIIGMLTGGKGLGAITGIFTSLGGVVRSVVGVFSRFTPVGLAITAILAVLFVAFEMLKKNVMGIRELFGNSLSRIGDTFKGILTKVVGILGVLWQAIKPVVMIVAGALLGALLVFSYVIEGLGKVIDGVMWVMVKLINAVVWLLNKIPGVSIDRIDLDGATKAAEEAKRGTGDGKPPTVNQDFRGSKFEITNNFPQGIDGGRVAVAFGDELARLGERRLDSGVRPLFSYR